MINIEEILHGFIDSKIAEVRGDLRNIDLIYATKSQSQREKIKNFFIDEKIRSFGGSTTDSVICPMTRCWTSAVLSLG